MVEVLSLALASVVISLMLTALAVTSFRSGRRLRATIFGLTLAHELILVVFPLWYSLVSGFALEVELGQTAGEILRVYLGEALFVALFCAGIAVADRQPRNMRPSRHPFFHEPSALVPVLVICGACFYFVELCSPTVTLDTLMNFAQIKVLGFWGSLWNWFCSFVRWPSIIVCALVVADRTAKRWLRWTSGFALLCQLLNGAVLGYRHGIVWVTSLILIGGLLRNRQVLLRYAFLMTICLMPLFSWLHSEMRYETVFAPEGTSRVAMIPHLLDGIVSFVQDPDVRARQEPFIQAWAERAQGPRNSITLYQLYDAGAGAGWRPLLGAVFLVVPHILYAQKPIAGSTDDTNFGSAVFLVQRGKAKSGPSEIGPFLASAHAYWEGGWPWLLAAGFVTGWFWERLIVWAETRRTLLSTVIVLTLVTGFPIDGFFTALSPLWTFLRVFIQIIIPLRLLCFALRTLPRKKRSRSAGTVGGGPKQTWGLGKRGEPTLPQAAPCVRTYPDPAAILQPTDY